MRALLFLLYPAVELYLLVKVGGEIGALNMVLWVFASAIIGLWAVRAQGQGAMNKARAELAQGRVPQNSFLDGLLLFAGGVLLILPGLISDAIGLFLLIPPFRRWTAQALFRYLTARAQQPGGASRVVFFRSTGFGGQPYDQSPTPPRDEDADPLLHESVQEPRQATVIESTAIDITETPSADSDKPSGNME